MIIIPPANITNDTIPKTPIVIIVSLFVPVGGIIINSAFLPLLSWLLSFSVELDSSNKLKLPGVSIFHFLSSFLSCSP